MDWKIPKPGTVKSLKLYPHKHSKNEVTELFIVLLNKNNNLNIYCLSIIC